MSVQESPFDPQHELLNSHMANDINRSVSAVLVLCDAALVTTNCKREETFSMSCVMLVLYYYMQCLA